MLLILTLTSLLCSVAHTADTSTDDAAIRDRIKAHNTAARAGDVAAMAKGFTPDGDIAIRENARYVVSERARGPRPANTGSPSVTATMDVQSIRYVTPDVAIAESINVLSNDSASKYRGTWVLVRQKGEWLVSAFRVLPPERSAQ